MPRQEADPKLASRLLIASGSIDLLLLTVFAKLLEAPVADFANLRGGGFWLALAALVPAHWILTELFFAGHSLGRVVVGLELRAADSDQPRFWARAGRLIRKLSLLGLGGLVIDRLPRHDRSGWRWTSDLATDRAPGEGRLLLRVSTSEDKGRALRLSEGSEARIGRDGNWADLKLKSSKVSGRHAKVRLRNGEIELMDCFSTNGTSIGQNRLRADNWYKLKSGETFKAADVTIRVHDV